MGKQKFANQTDMKVALLGDEDTVTGMVLAGIGHRDGQGRKNFLVVDGKTRRQEIEDAFNEFTNRRDICIVMITQKIADEIRSTVDAYTHSGKVIPTILEIPSKDCPYDAKKDSVMQRVAVFFGGNLDLE